MKRILFFALFLIANQAFSQDPYITYFKNNGTIVSDKEHADYLQIINDPEPGSKLYPVLEMYINGGNKTTGFSKSSFSPVYEGYVLTFFPNGKRESFSTYANGSLTGTSTKYYPNGKFYMTTEHKSYPEKYIEAKDSLGNEMITNGQGELKRYTSDFSRVIEEGKIVNGYKHGSWKGDTDTITYQEEYKKGILVSGISTDKEGKQYKYTKLVSGPKSDRDILKILSFVSSQLESTTKNKDLSSISNNFVAVTFTVDKNGYVKDPKIKIAVPLNVRKTIVDSLSQTPPIEPFLIRGIPSEHSLTLSFKLNP